MKKLGLISLAVSALLLTACGGGGSGSSDINAGNNKNDYGYYGGTTKFGDYPATRYWAMFDNHLNVMVLLLSDRGIFILGDKYETVDGVYGISGDAQTIKGDPINDIHIIGTSSQTWKVDGQVVHCYNVSGGDRDIVMCPDEAYHGGPIEKNLNNLMLKAYDSKVFSNVASENLK